MCIRDSSWMDQAYAGRGRGDNSGGDGELFFELLLFRQCGVVAVAGDQLVVAAEFDDAAGDQDGDLVGVARSGYAMGDEESGAAAHGLAQAGEDALLRVGVDRGERVVEDEDA